MQVAVVRPHGAELQPRRYSLAQRAALLCGVAFQAHLGAWHEALQAQSHDEAVPATYLVAMRHVVATEAAAGRIDADDAIAAAVAIAELGGSDPQQVARSLLQDLAAIGNRHAEILAVAITLIEPSRSALAQGRLELLVMSGAGTLNERTAVSCLLGETYLARGGPATNEAIAYRLFAAAGEENCSASAVAHFHLGVWYAQDGTEASFLLANQHFERGAEHGCAECLRALSDIHQHGDRHYAQELLELAELAGSTRNSIEAQA